MPTSYTAPLVDGHMTFEAFVLRAARAMGACVTLRDEPLDAPLPEALEPHPYYAQRVEEAEAEYTRLLHMTIESLQAEIDEKHTKALEAHAAEVRRREELRARLLAMRLAVLAWTPPTPEHTGLQRFMVEQLDATLEFDGTPPSFPVRPSVPAVLSRAWEAVLYARAAKKDEIERTASRNAWLRALRGSL